MKISTIVSSVASFANSVKQESIAKGEIFASIAGYKKEVEKGLTTAMGYEVREIPFSYLYNVPEARVEMQSDGVCYIAINQSMMGCKHLLGYALKHEEGHIYHDAFPGFNGHDLMSAELLADKHALKTATRQEIVSFITYLNMANVQFKKTDKVAYDINLARIKIMQEAIK